MFEQFKARRRQGRYEKALSRWQAERDDHARLLELARDFTGVPTGEIVLGPGEALFFYAEDVKLIEDRMMPGHYEGGYSGLSIPVARFGRRTINYNFGANRGHYVEDEIVATTVDRGEVFVTNRRVIFLGGRATRACEFARLIAVERSAGATTLSLSNRETPVTLAYDAALSPAFDFFLELALAHYHGSVQALVCELQLHLAQLEGHRPRAPIMPLALSEPTPAASAQEIVGERRACERRVRAGS